MWIHGRYVSGGVGSALMQALCNLADRWLGLERLDWTVYTDNASGVALYRKFGFEEEGRHLRYARRDGEWVDAFAMARIRLFGSSIGSGG